MRIRGEEHKMNEQLRKEVLEVLAETEVVIYEPTELASGEISDYYIDIKMSYGNPEILKLYVKYIKQVFSSEISGFTCVAGSGNGGIPLAMALSLNLGIRCSILRDKPKNHGKPVMVDGYIPDKNDTVLLVDDVFTTGGSIEKALRVLSENFPKIGSIFVICNRSKNPMPKVDGMNVGYILTAEDLMKS